MLAYVTFVDKFRIKVITVPKYH